MIDIVTMMVRDGLRYDDAYTLFHSKYDSDKNNLWAQYDKPGGGNIAGFLLAFSLAKYIFYAEKIGFLKI